MSFRELLEGFLSDEPGTNNPLKIVEIVSANISEGKINSVDKQVWKAYLDKTSRPEFLDSLKNSEKRHEWANQVFSVIRHCEFSLLDLFNQRVNEIPDKPLFQDASQNQSEWWTYDQVNRMTRQTAALFHQAVPQDPTAGNLFR